MDNYELIEFGYDKDQLKFGIITNHEFNLNYDLLKELIENTKPHIVKQFILPKEMDFFSKFDIKQLFSELGIKFIYDLHIKTIKSNRFVNKEQAIDISTFYQQTKVKIECSNMSNPLDYENAVIEKINISETFTYYIRHVETNMIILMGKVSQKNA